MSVEVAHSVVGQFDLSAKEKKELAKLLIEDASPKRMERRERFREHFKEVLRKSAKRRSPAIDRAPTKYQISTNQNGSIQQS